MTDPAVGYLPGQGYEPYDLGTELDVWVKMPNGSAAWAMSGQVCVTKCYQIWRREKIKSIYIGVTVYPGKRIL